MKYRLFENPQIPHIVIGMPSGNDFNAKLRITCLHCNQYKDLIADADLSFTNDLTRFQAKHKDCIDTSLN